MAVRDDRSMPEALLTLADICTRYRVSDRRARDIVHHNAVPVLHPGRKWLFDAKAETAFREATRLGPTPKRTRRAKKPR